MGSLEDNMKIKIVELIENADGTAEFQLEVADDFREAWMKRENLTEWDEEKFKRFFIESVKTAVAEDVKAYRGADGI